MIAIVGLPNTKNLGDPVLMQNTEALVRRAAPDQELVPVDIEFSDASAVRRFLYKGIRKVAGLVCGKGSNAYWGALIRVQRFCLAGYYRGKLSGAEAVIFAGGGIFKYRYEELGIRVAILVELAAAAGIPVMFNSVGVEGYDAQHPQARYLKAAVNKDAVKVITTRDDLETLQQGYVANNHIKTAWTPDSAWWSDVTFAQQIAQKPLRSVVGLGMIRKGIFSDNHFSLTDEELFGFWKGICDELVNRKTPFEFFTNGVQGDSEFIQEFVVRYPEFKEITVRIPTESAELVNVINSYSKIIASRMHTSIIAYSLAVPTMSILWNNKIKMFYDQIQHGDRVIDEHEMRGNHAPQIIDQLESVSYSDADFDYKREQRNLTKQYVQGFVDDYVGSENLEK
jgi:polysaccharide pyruvyl transferase WcaK-like protein